MRLKVSLILGLLLVCLLAVGAGGAFAQTESGGLKYSYSVSVTPQVVPLTKTVQVTLMGSGYEPKQSVRLLMKMADGVWTDISGYLADGTAPVANDSGTWVTVLNCGDYVNRKYVTEGVWAIMVADESWNTLATTTIGFVNTTKDVKEWPLWGKVAMGK